MSELGQGWNWNLLSFQGSFLRRAPCSLEKFLLSFFFLVFCKCIGAAHPGPGRIIWEGGWQGRAAPGLTLGGTVRL